MATKNTKLAALRSAAKTDTKQQLASSVHPDVAKPRILPDLSNPPTDNLPKDRAPMSAQTHESYAHHFAMMALAPKMPDNIDTQEAMNAWYASLTKQQQAAYLFEQEVEQDLDNADTIPTMALRWYFKLVDVYTVPVNGDATKTKCLLDEWPMPDTKETDESGKRINNPAIKEEPGFTKAGKPTAKNKVDFYDVLARSLREGQMLRKEIESLQAANPASKSKGTVLPKHKLLLPDQATDLLNAANQRWSRFKNNIKDAIKIRFKMAAIRGLKNVGVDFVYQVEYDAAGNATGKKVTTASTPFKVWDIGDDTNKYPHTIKNFLKLDVEWAKKNGGTLKALLQGEPAAPQTSTNPIKPITWATFDGTIAELAAYLGQSVNAAGLLAKACAKEGTGEALSDETVQSLGKVLIALDPVWKQIQIRYTALVTKQGNENIEVAKRQAAAVGE
jgi:hypothetical protein